MFTQELSVSRLAGLGLMLPWGNINPGVITQDSLYALSYRGSGLCGAEGGLA